MGTYDIAQICREGHVVNTMARDYPESNEAFCAKCGSATVTACDGCQAAIRGYYHVPGVLGGFAFDRPSYCQACGAPYPWTTSALAAAADLADEADGLSAQERDELKATFPDLVRDTARTQGAALRFRRLAAKGGKGAADALRSVLIEVVAEGAKKALWP
jgi:hypothetical protein